MSMCSQKKWFKMIVKIRIDASCFVWWLWRELRPQRHCVDYSLYQWHDNVSSKELSKYSMAQSITMIWVAFVYGLASQRLSEWNGVGLLKDGASNFSQHMLTRKSIKSSYYQQSLPISQMGHINFLIFLKEIFQHQIQTGRSNLPVYLMFSSRFSLIVSSNCQRWFMASTSFLTTMLGFLYVDDCFFFFRECNLKERRSWDNTTFLLHKVQNIGRYNKRCGDNIF